MAAVGRVGEAVGADHRVGTTGDGELVGEVLAGFEAV